MRRRAILFHLKAPQPYGHTSVTLVLKSHLTKRKKATSSAPSFPVFVHCSLSECIHRFEVFPVLPLISFTFHPLSGPEATFIACLQTSRLVCTARWLCPLTHEINFCWDCLQAAFFKYSSIKCRKHILSEVQGNLDTVWIVYVSTVIDQGGDMAYWHHTYNNSNICTLLHPSYADYESYISSPGPSLFLPSSSHQITGVKYSWVYLNDKGGEVRQIQKKGLACDAWLQIVIVTVSSSSVPKGVRAP